jgi:hypothetical protein
MLYNKFLFFLNISKYIAITIIFTSCAKMNACIIPSQSAISPINNANIAYDMLENTDFIEAKIQKIILNYLDMVDNPLAKFNRKINPGMYSIERERLLRSQAPTDFMRTYNIKPTTEAELRKRVKKHANGGWINGLTYSSLGEDGREVVIPLDKHRGRAVSLWKQAGQMIAPNETGRSGGGNLTTEVNFGEGSIVISVGDATPKTGKELARTMLTEIKKLIEQEQMRNYRMVRAR